MQIVLPRPPRVRYRGHYRRKENVSELTALPAANQQQGRRSPFAPVEWSDHRIRPSTPPKRRYTPPTAQAGPPSPTRPAAGPRPAHRTGGPRTRVRGRWAERCGQRAQRHQMRAIVGAATRRAIHGDNTASRRVPSAGDTHAPTTSKSSSSNQISPPRASVIRSAPANPDVTSAPRDSDW